MGKEISATMAIGLGYAHDHGGKLIRYVGGYWSWEGVSRNHNGAPVEYVGTPTIEALVSRGRMKYTEWKAGRNGRFPIAVEIAPDAMDDQPDLDPRTPEFGVAG